MRKSNYQRQLFWFALTVVSCLLVANFGWAKGVEDQLVKASDWISTKLIPAAAACGVGIGGVMAGFGSPLGWDIVKWSAAGGIIGTAGAETLKGLFF